MDYKELTAPCGLDCFNCQRYLASENEDVRKQLATKTQQQFGMSYDQAYKMAVCKGCRKDNGHCGGLLPEPCKVYKCVSAKGLYSCAECSDFPCDNLQPFAERASYAPHNTKVYNLALIKKMGVEKWAQEKSKQVRDTYFNGKFNI